MRPRVTLKLATSLDGKIAMASGESQWITGEVSRLNGHRLRASHDAILVGVETVLADDPQLTARIPGEKPKQPLRVVLDSRLRTPVTSKLAQGALILTTQPSIPVGSADVRTVAADVQGRVDIHSALQVLALENVRSVLIEGGGRVAASFMALGFVDAIEWFRAPIVIGEGGRPGVASLGFEKLFDAPRFRRLAVEPSGDDLWERYEKA